MEQAEFPLLLKKLLEQFLGKEDQAF